MSYLFSDCKWFLTNLLEGAKSNPRQCSVVGGPCKLKLDEEKSKHVGLVHQNSFGPAFLHILLSMVKGAQQILIPDREQCNKYDLTAAPCF